MAITHEFTRVWWETGEAGAGRAASLWRPMAPPGHASLGDVLVTGVEPPPHGAPTVSVRGGAAVRPVAFDLVCSAVSGRGRGLRENKHSTLNRRKTDIGGLPSTRATVTVNAYTMVCGSVSTQFSPGTKWSHLLHAKMSQIGTCLYARLVFHILSFSISKV